MKDSTLSRFPRLDLTVPSFPRALAVMPGGVQGLVVLRKCAETSTRPKAQVYWSSCVVLRVGAHASSTSKKASA